MDNLDKIREATKGFGKNQMLALKLLYDSPQPVSKLNSIKSAVFSLQDRGLAKINNNKASLTDLGKGICELPVRSFLSEVSQLG